MYTVAKYNYYILTGVKLSKSLIPLSFFKTLNTGTSTKEETTPVLILDISERTAPTGDLRVCPTPTAGTTQKGDGELPRLSQAHQQGFTRYL